MKTEDQNISNRELDRLVDGQVAGEQYRQVLRKLEQQPDGWRRCGLAFLEEQALRSDLADCQQELDIGSVVDADVELPLDEERFGGYTAAIDGRRRMIKSGMSYESTDGRLRQTAVHWIRSPFWGLGLAVAASLLAFATMYSVRLAWTSTPGNPVPGIMQPTPQATVGPQSGGLFAIGEQNKTLAVKYDGPALAANGPIQVPIQGPELVQADQAPSPYDWPTEVELQSTLDRFPKPCTNDCYWFVDSTEDGAFVILPVQRIVVSRMQ